MIYPTFAAWLLTPGSWFLLLQLCALWWLFSGRVRRARWLFSATILAALAVATPVPGMLIRPLEQAYPAPRLPDKVDGVIVLGGAERFALSEAYGKPHFGNDSERASEFVSLARAYPGARLMFSGSPGDTYVFKLFLQQQGFDATRILFDDHVHNTYESAVSTHRLLQPKPGEVWVLITSASHMPRAYGAFRKAGWNEMVAYPVAYKALPRAAAVWDEAGADTLNAAAHEWLGLAAYRLSGRL